MKLVAKTLVARPRVKGSKLPMEKSYVPTVTKKSGVNGLGNNSLAEPQFVEGDVFRITIPLTEVAMATVDRTRLTPKVG